MPDGYRYPIFVPYFEFHVPSILRVYMCLHFFVWDNLAFGSGPARGFSAPRNTERFEHRFAHGFDPTAVQGRWAMVWIGADQWDGVSGLGTQPTNSFAGWISWRQGDDLRGSDHKSWRWNDPTAFGWRLQICLYSTRRDDDHECFERSMRRTGMHQHGGWVSGNALFGHNGHQWASCASHENEWRKTSFDWRHHQIQWQVQPTCSGRSSSMCALEWVSLPASFTTRRPSWRSRCQESGFFCHD